MEPEPVTLEHYETKAVALLTAYRTGTPEALEAHYRLTWHRRAWPAMRSYVQLDLGRRPAEPGADVEITLDDARFLIAKEHGFADWNALLAHVVQSGVAATLTAPVRVASSMEEQASTLISSRDWSTVLRTLAAHDDSALHAHGQITDDMLTSVAAIAQVTALQLSNCQSLTNAGIQQLARMPQLRHLDLSQTAVTDDGLRVLRELPALESLALTMTRVTDAGVQHLRDCHALRRVNLMWTNTGNAAIAALAGKLSLTHFQSGNLVTNDGLALLHALPAFREWNGAQPTFGILRPDNSPNMLALRGSFTDTGMEHLRGLDGLFGLNLDDSALQLTSRAMIPLATLPRLGRLAVDAKDDWMPIIASMPALRFLSAQDTVAGDDGFSALSASQSLEYIWGRRCHNLRTRGFRALRNLPQLRGLSVSCLNVADDGIALLPEFPALRELMPMDIPDAGYRHIGRCTQLESLQLMYCRDTTDAATEHLTALRNLTRYFNSYTAITDRTPMLLSGMESLEEVTFDACHNLTDAGIGALARLPRLTTLRVAGNALTANVSAAFPAHVSVYHEP
jgi:hypothetical protein